MFTCLALCCSLLEVESEELSMSFKNTKREMQKNKNKCNTMWIPEQLTKPMEINYLKKQNKQTKKQENPTHLLNTNNLQIHLPCQREQLKPI